MRRLLSVWLGLLCLASALPAAAAPRRAATVGFSKHAQRSRAVAAPSRAARPAPAEAPAQPAPRLYVSQAALGANTGLSWTDAYTNVQLALTSVISGTPTEIWVARGTYLPGPQGTIRATFDLPRGAALYGGFAATETLRIERNIAANPTILSGDLAGNDQPVPNQFYNRQDNVFRLVTMRGADQTTVLDGFTLTNSGNNLYNTSSDHQAALTLEQSSPQLANLHLTRSYVGLAAYQSAVQLRDSELDFNENSDYDNEVIGGGMDLNASTATLSKLVIHDNKAAFGAGIRARHGSAVRISDTIIRDNQQWICGGGLSFDRSVLHLSNSSIQDNRPWPFGSCATPPDYVGNYDRIGSPGIFLNRSTAFITGTNILSNTWQEVGTGIGLINSTLHLRDSLVAGHVDNYGTIHAMSSDVWLDHVTVRQNQSRYRAGGLYLEYSSAHVSASIFDHNAGGTGGAVGAYMPSPQVVLITDTLFLGNQARTRDGGAVAASGLVTITNSIFSGNRAVRSGGAVYIDEGAIIRPGTVVNSHVTLINTTLVSNTAPLGSVFGSGIYR